MTANTPRYSLTYPLTSDAPHGPNQIQDLAQDVESALGTLDDYVHATAIGGEYRASALQSLTGLTSTKLTFGTTVKAANGITWNGTNTFTVLTAGVYSLLVTLKVPFLASNSWGVSLGPTSYQSGTGMYVPEDFGFSATDFASSGCRWLDVGANICAYVYNNQATANSDFAARPAEFSVWKVG